MNRQFNTALFAALLLTLAAARLPAADAGFYVGANIGGTTYRHDAADFDDGSLALSGRVDEHDSGRKVLAGYRFGRHLGLEIGHTVLNQDYDARVTFSNATSDGSADFPIGSVAVDIHRPEATFLAAVIALPVADRVELYGKVGLQRWEARLTTFASLRVTERRESDVDSMLGVGLSVRVTRSWAVRAEYERFQEIAGDDIDLASIGFVYRFGSGKS